MKNVYRNIMGTVLAGTAAMSLTGCGAPEASTNSATAAAVTSSGITTTTTTTTETGIDSSVTGFTGDTVTLTVNGSALHNMFYQTQPTSATNIRLSLDTTRVGSEVIISFEQNGYTTQDALGSVHPWNKSVQNTQYNGWTNDGNTPVWKAFYQDAYGAVVIVVDGSQNTGDGTSSAYNGEIWFQNFPTSTYPASGYAPAQGPNSMCWDITAGPYDCRTFLVGSNLDVNSSLYPNNRGPNATSSYQLLGTFSGLVSSAAGF